MIQLRQNLTIFLSIQILSSSFFLCQNASAKELPLQILSQKCRNIINKNMPTVQIKNKQPKLSKKHDGELSLDWSDIGGTYFKSDKLELQAAHNIGKACPEISMVAYHGTTGGVSRWYMKTTNFQVRHSRGSGLPGDWDKYWDWRGIPTNYNPYHNYDPSSD